MCLAVNTLVFSTSGKIIRFRNFIPLSMLPLHVPEGKKLLVAACNFGNVELHPYNDFPGVPLIPLLTGSVGEKAKVIIRVQKSANVGLHGDVSFASEES